MDDASKAMLERFDPLDVIATGDYKGDRMSTVKAQYAAQPTNANWYDKNVGVPQRMALATMFCIIAYEAVVFASMGVRSLRWLMVNWLMYVLLAVNVAMMLILAGFVYVKKKDMGISFLTDLATGRGKEKQQFAV